MESHYSRFRLMFMGWRQKVSRYKGGSIFRHKKSPLKWVLYIIDPYSYQDRLCYSLSRSDYKISIHISELNIDKFFSLIEGVACPQRDTYYADHLIGDHLSNFSRRTFISYEDDTMVIHRRKPK